MTMFWVWIVVLTLAIVGVSVLVGRSLSRPTGRQRLSREERMTALKASGALKHRKSNRN
jgi:hypothetical protein